MASSVSLRPLDVTDFADRLLASLPELRGQLTGAMAAAGRAAAASAPSAAGAVRQSGSDVQHAITGLDTSLSRLAAALKLAVADLIDQDAAMFGQSASSTPPAAVLPGGLPLGGLPLGGQPLGGQPLGGQPLGGGQ